jgi:hypothetical protein
MADDLVSNTPFLMLTVCRQYRTANSCIDWCEAAECGPAYSSRRNAIVGNTPDWCSSTLSTEIFRDCADIRIGTGGGTTPAPTPGSTPATGVCVHYMPSPASAALEEIKQAPQEAWVA